VGQKLQDVQSVTLRFSLSVAGDPALPKQVSCDVSKSASAVHDKRRLSERHAVAMIAAIACKKKRVLQNSTGQLLRQGKFMQNCLVKVSC
jgi:hypothetical protein